MHKYNVIHHLMALVHSCNALVRSSSWPATTRSCRPCWRPMGRGMMPWSSMPSTQLKLRSVILSIWFHHVVFCFITPVLTLVDGNMFWLFVILGMWQSYCLSLPAVSILYFVSVWKLQASLACLHVFYCELRKGKECCQGRAFQMSVQGVVQCFYTHKQSPSLLLFTCITVYYSQIMS